MEVLEKVKNQMKSYVDEINDKKSFELLGLLSAGKMLRSKLILKIAGINEESIKLCAIVEMIHAASLLHDDVLDDADTRRGKPSINKVFDNKTAIMFGDVLYSKAFTELTKMPNNIAYSISNAVTLLSVGEMMDIELGKTFNSDFDKYFDMIYKKTGSLIEASATSAALLANKNHEIFAKYGRCLGLAFQMIDDILDITSDSTTLGKPAMNDFVEGKVTIPYLLTYAKLDKEEQKKFESLYLKPLTIDEQNWIKQKMNETKSLQKSIDLAKRYGFEALKAIENEHNSDLEEIMKQMIERDF